MNNVVSLQERKPHMAGEAKCLACTHEWIAVAPIGSYVLVCPSCSLEKGVFKRLCGPENDIVWVCNCGCDQFYIDQKGVRCLVCATIQDGY